MNLLMEIEINLYGINKRQNQKTIYTGKKGEFFLFVEIADLNLFQTPKRNKIRTKRGSLWRKDKVCPRLCLSRLRPREVGGGGGV